MRRAFFNGFICRSDEVANVVQCFDRFDIEAGVGWYVELLTTFKGLPFGFASQQDAAFARIQFHDLCRAGIELQRRREDHADGFFGAVCKHDAVRDTFAIKVDVGFLDDGNVIELSSHDLMCE